MGSTLITPASASGELERPLVLGRREAITYRGELVDGAPTGTVSRAGANALPPIDRSLRVETGIVMRSSSTSAPLARWYAPAAPPAPATKMSFTLPPRAFAARFVSSSGIRSTSKRRRSERSVHSGERAWSVTDAWRTSDCTARDELGAQRGHLVGMAGEVGDVGDRSPSDAELTAQVVRRGFDHRADERRRLGGLGVVFAIGGSARSCPSRLKSMNSADMRTPPSPSVIVWWIFWNSAARPPSRPSMIVNSHNGRVRSSGCAASAAARSNNVRSVAGSGQADVADVVVEIELRRPATAAEPDDRMPGRRVAAARHHPHGVLHGLAQTFDVGRLVEDRDVGERRGERGILLEVPHQRFDVAHAPVTADRTCRLVGHGVEATA